MPDINRAIATLTALRDETASAPYIVPGQAAHWFVRTDAEREDINTAVEALRAVNAGHGDFGQHGDLRGVLPGDLCGRQNTQQDDDKTHIG